MIEDAKGSSPDLDVLDNIVGRAILHLGASKCGSTAIQCAASSCPYFEDYTGRPVIYGALDRNCVLVTADRILARAQRSLSSSIRSPSIHQLRKMGPDQWQAFANSVAQNVIEHDATLLLSCEEYYVASRTFAEVGILEQLDLVDTTVIVYVRPQLDYLNSAWWQWGAWTNQDFASWLQDRKGRALWASHLSGWSSVPGVTKLIVRPLPVDVVSDFFRLIKAHPPEPNRRVNTSLPAAALRLMQRHPYLRPVHNPAVDFVLGRVLSEGRGHAPWVIDEKQAADLVQFYRDDNDKLKSLMDDESRAIMEADLRWWDASVYSDKLVESAHAVAAQDQDLDGIVVDIIKALVNLETKARANGCHN